MKRFSERSKGKHLFKERVKGLELKTMIKENKVYLLSLWTT